MKSSTMRNSSVDLTSSLGEGESYKEKMKMTYPREIAGWGQPLIYLESYYTFAAMPLYILLNHLP
jgi:hypothetical protein